LYYQGKKQCQKGIQAWGYFFSPGGREYPGAPKKSKEKITWDEHGKSCIRGRISPARQTLRANGLIERRERERVGILKKILIRSNKYYVDVRTTGKEGRDSKKEE